MIISFKETMAFFHLSFPSFLLIFFLLFSQLFAQEAHSLKVLAYNIHHANPPSRPGLIDIEAIADLILEYDPDLVALQEVDVNTKRSGVNLDQAHHLARLTGMNYFFEPSIPFQGGGYGNAILSKFAIEKKSFFQLSAEEETEPRSILTIQVTLPGNKKVKFASTHLDYSKPSNTVRQAKDIVKYYMKEKLPVIIAGDFNAEIGSEAINLLDDSFERTCPVECPPTIPVTNPQKTIDFIFYKSKKAFNVERHEVISETYASDHLPVFAVLSY
jgi:endonuclease/exonuclease/phosphatase family metal-dependent hydrolase